MHALILKALQKGFITLKYPKVEDAEAAVKDNLRLLGDADLSSNENLHSILANCMSKKEILVVAMPSKVPASFVALCRLDAVIDAARFASEALARTRQETQGQLAANALVMGRVSDAAILLDELDVIFTQELMVARVLGFNTARRTQIVETMHAEADMLQIF
jgi:alpha-L-fucosidase